MGEKLAESKSFLTQAVETDLDLNTLNPLSQQPANGLIADAGGGRNTDSTRRFSVPLLLLALTANPLKMFSDAIDFAGRVLDRLLRSIGGDLRLPRGVAGLVGGSFGAFGRFLRMLRVGRGLLRLLLGGAAAGDGQA